MSQTGTVRPAIQLAYEGSPVSISCYSKSPIIWTKNGIVVAAHLVIINDLIINNVKQSDSGIYTCTGYIDMESKDWFSADSSLLVGSKFVT